MVHVVAATGTLKLLDDRKPALTRSTHHCHIYLGLKHRPRNADMRQERGEVTILSLLFRLTEGMRVMHAHLSEPNGNGLADSTGPANHNRVSAR